MLLLRLLIRCPGPDLSYYRVRYTGLYTGLLKGIKWGVPENAMVYGSGTGGSR